MGTKRNQLPLVKDLPGETIAQFKVVGVDEWGEPLYQRVKNRSTGDKKVSGSDSAIKKVIKPSPLSNPQIKDYEMAPSLRELRHQQTKTDYPELGKLMDNEFVLTIVERHPLGTMVLWCLDLFLVLAITIIWFIFLANNGTSTLVSSGANDQATTALIVIVVVVDLLLLLAGWIGVSIYKANRLFITSERVIQFVARGPFDRKRQAIDLSGIEDVASSQKGVFATIFNYGTIRLSTIGDESTYTLTFVQDPNEVANRLNVVLQAVKNARPVPSKLK